MATLQDLVVNTALPQNNASKNMPEQTQQAGATTMQGAVQGAQIGSELLQRHIAMQQFQFDTQMKTQEFNRQVNGMLLDKFYDAASTPDKAVRDAKFDSLQTTATNFKRPFNQDTIDMINKSDQVRGQLMQGFSGSDMTDPNVRSAMANQMMSVGNMGAAESAKFINDWSQQQVQLKMNKILADNKQNIATGNNITTVAKQAMAHASPGDQAIISDAIRTGNFSDPNVTQALARSQTGLASATQAKEGAGLQNIQSQIDYRKQRGAQFKAQLGLQYERLGLSRSRLAMSAADKVDKTSEQYQTQLGAINKGMAALDDPNLTFTGFKEVKTDLAGLMSVKPATVVSAYREQGIDPGQAMKDMALLRTYFSPDAEWKGVVPQGAKDQIRGMFTRMGAVQSNLHDAAVQERINSAVATKAWTPELGQQKFDEIKFNQNSRYLPPGAAAKASPFSQMAGGIKSQAPAQSSGGAATKLTTPSGAYINALKSLPTMQTNGQPDPGKIKAELQKRGYDSSALGN